MEVIDNFKNLEEFLKFESKDDYYFLQIIQRRKDNLGMKCDARGIKSYYITSTEMLDDFKEEIINLCHFFNARAYLHVNPRSWKMTVTKTISNLVDRVGSDSLIRSHTVFDRVSSSYQKPNLGKSRLWVIDIDNPDIKMEQIKTITSYIDSIPPISDSSEGKVKCVNPTKSGYHIITSPFNITEFRKTYSDKEIEIKKSESPTLLYMQIDNEKNLEYCKPVVEYGGKVFPITLYVKDIDKLISGDFLIVKSSDLRDEYTNSWKNIKFPKTFIPILIDHYMDYYIGVDRQNDKIYIRNSKGTLNCEIFESMIGLYRCIQSKTPFTEPLNP